MDSTDSHKRPISVGFLSPAWPRETLPNGIVAYLENLSTHLKAEGHRVSVVTSQVARELVDPRIYCLKDHEAKPNFLQKLINHIEYHLAPEATNQRRIQGLLVKTISRAISEQGIQVFQMEESFGWAWWVKKSINIPLVVRLHGPWFLNGKVLGGREDSQYRERVDLEGRAIAAADMITAPSQDVIDQTRDYYGLALEYAQVIPNPIYPVAEAERWHLRDCDPKRVLFIGRFDRHKGGDLLIESFIQVLKVVPEARLTFVGPDRTCVADDGKTWTLLNFIKNRIPGALESGKIEWLGQQPNSALHALRRKALMCLAPSRYENFGNTVTEALSLGCPVICANTGGFREIVRDETTGLLHKPGDVQDLADKIIGLLKDPNLAARLAAQGYADAHQRFHPDFIAARHVDLYRTLSQRDPIH